MNGTSAAAEGPTPEDIERFLANLAGRVPLKVFLGAAIDAGLTVAVDQATRSIVLQRAPKAGA